MDRQQLICETLESISEYLPKLSAASAKIATDIQSHQSNWLETLIAYLEGVAWLTLAIEGISKLDPEILASWNLGELNRLLDELKNGECKFFCVNGFLTGEWLLQRLYMEGRA
ncbi:hypothetical protein [Brevibacillus agri]|uniref:hypothetical protein n=1 Tax=Brevibacillus agri TaxID=51101 RepID=UPI003D9A5A71